MSQMLLSTPVIFPTQYQVTCENFLRDYWDDRRREMEQEFGVMDLPLDVDLHRMMIADLLRDISNAAAGETEHLDSADVYECIQTLCECLFAAPGIGSSYHIPREFWDAPIGQMVGRALAWINHDDLITLTEAVEISGISIKTLSSKIERGMIRSYPDSSEPNPQKRNRVLRSEIEALKKK
jgi:hypothetical protein